MQLSLKQLDAQLKKTWPPLVFISGDEPLLVQESREMVFSHATSRGFSEREMMILEEVCRRFGNETTKTIEDASHKEAPWRLTKETENIPYILAAKDDDCLVEASDIELLTRLS